MLTSLIVASQESGIAARAVPSQSVRSQIQETEIGKLKRWMKVVGVLYIINGMALGISFVVPAVGEASIGARVPGAELSGPMYEFALDTWLMFGFEMLVVGAALLWASRDAWTNRVLAWTVIALEAVRGVVDDLIWIARGYTTVVYIGWIVFHIGVIATGASALRSADVRAEVPA
jgi:hypothetical protein